jgi:hypothetical protein
VDTLRGPQPIRQFPEWATVLNSGASIIVPAAGEGSGKSLHGGLFLTAHTIYDLQWGTHLYWVVGADYEDARKDFEYYMDFAEQLDDIKERSIPNNKDTQCVIITHSGHEIRTISSYDFTKIAREEPFGILGAEVSRWFPETFSRCEGRLLRNYPHSWMFASGSPESSTGFFKDIYEYGQGPNEGGIRSYSIPSWCNLEKYPGGRDDPAIRRAEARSSPQRFAERFGAEFVPPKGLVCHSFRYNLHVDPELEFDPTLPVYIAIDPGGIVYAISFNQFTPDGEVHMLDEIYAFRWPHQEILNEYLQHPLSSAVVGGAIDIASTQPQNAMPLAYDEWFKATGLPLWIEKHSVDDTVERLYWVLANNPNTGRPRLRVHPQCKGFISECGGGTSPVPDGGAWMRFEHANGLGAPMRKNDHAAKALGYMLAGPYSFLASERALRDSEPVSYLAGRRRGGQSASYV